MIAIVNMKTNLSEVAIGAKIKAQKQFFVRTNGERINALRCAKFLGLKVTTCQRDDKSGWDIVPVNQ